MKRKIAYNIILFFITLIFLGIIELLLRVASVGNNVNLIIKHPSKQYNEYYMVNPLIGEKYFSRFEATQGTNDIFLKEKPQNGFRLFVLGSSTLVGFPYEKNLMATRILQNRLEDAYPNKKIEVINTAITAINSISLNDYMNDIVKYDADALLIYAGHNEFYGAFGIGSNETMSQNTLARNLHLNFMHLRLYQLMHSAFIKIPALLAKKNSTGDSKGSLMKRIVSDENIAYNGDKYKAGLNQYTANVSDIIKKAQKNNIPVFISNLVSNIKDLKPLGDDKNANNLFSEAQLAHNTGDSALAIQKFYQAKDLDPVRFRASEDINHIIDSLSDTHNCYYINTKELFQKQAKNGLIGNNFITEHVHPNIEGQFLLAESFYSNLIKSKIIDKETSIYNLKDYKYYRNNWGYSELDSLIGVYKVKQLMSYWPFTSLNTTTTFRDTYTPKNHVDSLAFSVLFKNKSTFDKQRSNLAEMYFEEGNYNKALLEFKALTNSNPYWYNNYNKTVQCLLKLDDLHEAEKYLKKSIEYQPNYYAHLMLAEIEMIKLDLNKAITHYNSALILAIEESQKIEVLKKLNMAYFHNKNIAEQNEILKQLESFNIKENNTFTQLTFSYSNYIPYNIKPYFEQANKYIINNQIDSAINILFQSCYINDCPFVNKTIGDLLYSKKQNSLLHFYNKAYPAYAKNPEFLYNYVIAHYVNKDAEGATKYLNELKAIHTANIDTKSLESLIKSIKTK